MATKEDKKDKEIEVKDELIQPVKTDNLIDFDKAFRIFKKTADKAKSWDAQAVFLFAKKQDPALLKTLENWSNIFNRY